MSHSKKKSNKVSRNQKRTRDVGPASQKCQNIFWKKETQKKKKVVKMNYCVAKRDQSFPSELGSWSIRWPMISFVRHPALQKMPRLASAQEPKTRMNRVIECRLTRSTACVLLMPFHLVAFRVIRAMGAYIEQDGNKWMIDFKRPGFFFFAAPSHNLDALEKEWARTRVVVNIE